MNQTNQRNKILEMYILLATDVATIIISYLLALLSRFGTLGGGMTGLHSSTCLCFLFVSVVYSMVLDWNSSFIKRGYYIEFLAVVKYNLVMVVLVATVLFATSRAELFSRMVWGYILTYNTLLTFGGHILIKKLLRRYYRSEHCRVKVMVVTDNHEVSHLMDNLAARLPMNYDVTSLGMLGPEGDRDVFYRNAKADIYRASCVEELIEQVKQLPLDEVFIYVSDLKAEQIQNLIRNFESMGIVCHYSIEIAEWNAKESTIGKFADYTVVSYSIYKIDYRRQILKRMIDIVGGVVGLILTALIYPFVAIAIKCTSPGPVLFSQTRIGKNGRRFKLYKFRSMYIDAEERKKQLMAENEMSGYMFKLENDPRITSVGRFIRKTSLDEFPQFFNVLRGDMSLIGTRPPTEDEFEQYSPYYRRRLSMTPGLTGLWQVSGRSDIQDFDEVVKLDLEYIDNWSLTLDFKILIKTFWVVLTGKGSK